ncbi:hypothetical protein TcasGA2_TC031617 [Tribolium castaneum]|uniref:Uncharacterized protein n=1 Tax=Tribolium castaneum TaxID=7070 RepID=A0A139WAI7_TRICA|nr:hypothetical protein TcasGA2_TC031617 [Tribolium castaneum]
MYKKDSLVKYFIETDDNNDSDRMNEGREEDITEDSLCASDDSHTDSAETK